MPKGLRSFEAEDADFFLTLLPGPCDRHGLPGIVRFWKNRIEEQDADKTFSVGVIYGPSGCGKSSLVRGIVPHLGSHIVPVYVESSANDTEVRLFKSLRTICPDIPEEISLPQLFDALRNDCGHRPARSCSSFWTSSSNGCTRTRANPKRS